MPRIITGIIVSYLIGSIPTAYIFARLLKGVDIRKFGSGNVGATNALRLLGKKTGITVLVLDIFKGTLAVLLLTRLSGPEYINHKELVPLLLGISCICGHIWTVFLRFKGGKGVATSLGVLLGLGITIKGLWYVLLLTIITWVVSFLIIRIVSAASLLAAISLPVYTWLNSHNKGLIFSSIIISAIVIFRHTSNLKRILQGKEPRLTFSKEKS